MKQSVIFFSIIAIIVIWILYKIHKPRLEKGPNGELYIFYYNDRHERKFIYLHKFERNER